MNQKAKKGSVGSAMMWMFFISLLLFWLPGIGPLIAGLVGGKKAGGVGPAILAVFFPGIIFGMILFLDAALLTGVPLIGFVAALGGFTLSITHVGPLLLGAILGGFLGET
ncbi:MAG: hypothetical protein EXS63_04155 [Candidatus Omnitrophica bacterium]|nr:hypothetical protein [Candidatus Omnitrophota bacterium]